MTLPTYLGISQAAEIIGLSPSMLKIYCRRGELGRKIGRDWLITRAEAVAFRRRPRKPRGNPAFGRRSA